jgi:DUF1680 family protein
MEQDPPEKLKTQYRRLKEVVLATQRPDGYINTHTIKENLEPFGLRSLMDFYFSGHLMQAGIAELRATGEEVLFDAAKRYVDLLIETYTGGGKEFHRWEYPGKREHVYPFTDHPNFEMAVVELYRVTGDEKYLDFCKRILDFGDFGHKDAVEAHGVMEALFNAGAIDYYLETGDQLIWQGALAQWKDMIRKMYITGGVGAFYRAERFAKPYDLPNSRAYAETCMAISTVFWNWRMFLATGEARYVDLVERGLYNGVLSGISLSGDEYFYCNPLEYREYRPHPPSESYCSDEKYWVVQRHDNLWCSCCPPNLHRLLASFQQYIYAVQDDVVWINLFVGSVVKHRLSNGGRLTLEQITGYPWKGDVEIRVSAEKPLVFSLMLRIPDWSNGTRVSVNGEREPIGTIPKSGSYLEIAREWRDGDVVEVDFPLPVRLEGAHPRITSGIGKVAICRGPLVYCLESADHPEGNLFDIRLSLETEFGVEYRPDLLGGIVLIEGSGFFLDTSGWDERPYQEHRAWGENDLRPVAIRAVPYYAWANRGHGSMITAVPYSE